MRSEVGERDRGGVMTFWDFLGQNKDIVNDFIQLSIFALVLAFIALLAYLSGKS